MNTLVSILIPAYNAEQYIGETIQSALSQTWDCKEIIIVDDGSKDRSLQIAKQHESKILKVISQENKGSAASRNKALEYAQGNYIQWLDADDILAPDKIDKQLKALDTIGDQRILLTSRCAPFYYRTQKAHFKRNDLWQDLAPAEWLIAKFNGSGGMNPAPWLVSRELTERAGLWDAGTAPNDDGEYICRVAFNSKQIKFVPEAKSYYRKANPNSLSHDISDNVPDRLLRSYTLCIGYLRNLEDSERARAACLKLLQNGLSGFYPEHAEKLKSAEGLAEQLGGKLFPPLVNWRYSLIIKVFGWSLAKKIKRNKAAFLASFAQNYDRVLDRLMHK